MAKAKKNSLQKWQENYASLILGAIIVVIIGLLVANFITQKGEDIDTGEQITQEEEQLKQTQEYTVVADDSLSKISEKFYGDLNMWPVLVRENNIKNPNIIHVGAKITIPAKELAENIKQDMTITSYKVEAGDTLFKISEKVYGNGGKWTIIARANKVGKLPNGNPLIFAESTLVIPR